MTSTQKVAIVTGAISGIGKASALALMKEGYAVVFAGRRKDLLESAAAEGKGLFVLVRTSNASAGEFQDLFAEGRPLYRHVAEHLTRWAEPELGSSGYSLVGAVVGATYPAELAELRGAMPGVLFLVPGYGAQGGTAAGVAAAFDDVHTTPPCSPQNALIAAAELM